MILNTLRRIILATAVLCALGVGAFHQFAPAVSGPPAIEFSPAQHSDGCSGKVWVTLTGKEGEWRPCCVKHDKLFYVGGTAALRRLADRELRQCVAAMGHPIIGAVMEWSVRLGGSPVFPTSYRWNYGHEYPMGYAVDAQAVSIAWPMIFLGLVGFSILLLGAEQSRRWSSWLGSSVVVLASVLYLTS